MKVCENCGKEFEPKKKHIRFCHQKCWLVFQKKDPQYREKMSATMASVAANRERKAFGIKGKFMFRNEAIRYDSCLELACLEWFCQTYNVLTIRRSSFSIPYLMNGEKKTYIPDFEIETTTSKYLVECKSEKTRKVVNERWKGYEESAKVKKEILKCFCLNEGFEPYWFDDVTHRKFYRGTLAQLARAACS